MRTMFSTVCIRRAAPALPRLRVWGASAISRLTSTSLPLQRSTAACTAAQYPHVRYAHADAILRHVGPGTRLHTAWAVHPRFACAPAARVGVLGRDTRGGDAGEKGRLEVQLPEVQKGLLRRHHAAVRDVLEAVRAVDGVDAGDVRLLAAQLERFSDGLFLLVVVGEYNSGKSSCINALLGQKVVAEGVVPTTAEVIVIKYAGQGGVAKAEDCSAPLMDDDGVAVIAQPVEILRNISLVDSPGTNAIDRKHEVLTRKYLPLCDLVLFVTSADRPFSESERMFLKSIRAWGKKCVMVINKADLVADPAGMDEVVNFVKKYSRSLLGSTQTVLAVSSRLAFEAKTAGNLQEATTKWDASGFDGLETFISKSLNAEERLEIKLKSIVSVAETVGKKYVEKLCAEKKVFVEDRAALSAVANVVARCRDSIERGFPAHFARIDTALLEMVERAEAFFDSNVSVLNASMLMRKDAIEQVFMQQVVQGTARDVERRSRSLAEWASEKATRNIAAVASILSRRVGERKAESVWRNGSNSLGMSNLSFPQDPDGFASPEQLVSDLGDAAAELTSHYQPDVEGKRIADTLTASVRATLAVEFSALGVLGSCLAMSSADVYGLTSFAALAIGGLVILPRRRRILRAEMRTRVANLRTQLERELKGRIREQMRSHAERIQAAVEPFEVLTASREETATAQHRALEAALFNLQRLGNCSQVPQVSLQANDLGHRRRQKPE